MNDATSASRETLRRFVEELRGEYVPWYVSSVSRLGGWYATLQLLALLSGFVTAVLAALLGNGVDSTLLRYAVVVLPTLGSLAATCLLQFRVQDRLQLREEGRIGFQDLEITGRRLLAAAKTDADCIQALADLQRAATEIERRQSTRFFGLSKVLGVARFGGAGGDGSGDN